MPLLKRIAIFVALSWIAAALAGCNTIEGAGKDIKAAGGAIEKSAGKNKGY
jgi:predicted small secreted protein